MRRHPCALGAVCAVTALALDQATKALAVTFVSDLVAGIEVLPVLNLIYLRNPGVSFGLFGSVPWWGLTALGLVIVALLTVCLASAQSRLVAAALGLMIGGALGNLLDRVRHGAVTDFLDLHIAAYHWPAFNLADVALVGAVGLLLADGLRRKERRSGARALGRPGVEGDGHGSASLEGLSADSS